MDRLCEFCGCERSSLEIFGFGLTAFGVLRAGLGGASMNGWKVMNTDEFSFRLKPSPIHGVGVFATHFIDAGTLLDLWGDEKDTRFLRLHPLVRKTEYSRAMLDFVETFGIEGHCPPLFNRMAVGWYLNHSDVPNTVNRDDEFFALGNILAHEELTIDYRSLYVK